MVQQKIRILRAYISSADTSYEFHRLVNYIINVFLPVFLEVKLNSKFEYGPHHILKEILAMVKYCTNEERDVLEPIINWNGFNAHPENIQVALLCSAKLTDRLLGVNTIMNIRKEGQQVYPVPRCLKNDFSIGVRPFRVPVINFEAAHISELTDLSLSTTEAPLTMAMTDTEIKSLVFTPLDLKGLPCHTTACERGVQLTTSSAMVAADHDLRDGCSFNKIAARERNKNANTKQWKV